MILIVGGAGYIGSHVAKLLLENNEKIIILDNLSTGSKKTLDTLSKINYFKFINEDLKNFDKIEEIFENNNIETVLHFAASIVVSESISNPLKYYMNNTVNTTNLISCAIRYDVKKFIFSSTAAVYGESINMPKEGVSETFSTNPMNPYGESKLMCENILKDAAKTNSNFKYVIFRYFNVSGADINYSNGKLTPRFGQSSLAATNLIKIVSECANEKKDEMSIFGDDYDSSDGTCVRDYIHVDDVASSHILAINYLNHNDSDTFNIGYSKGYSVKMSLIQ